MSKLKSALKEEALLYAKEFVELASTVAVNATEDNDSLSGQKLKELMHAKTDVFVDKILKLVKPE